MIAALLTVLVAGCGDIFSNLRERELVVDLASDGLSALRKAHNGAYELAVVSADMPGQPTGLETAYWLRHLYCLPIAVVTTRMAAEQQRLAAIAAPEALLVDPVSRDELRAMLAMGIARRARIEAERELAPFHKAAGSLPRAGGFLELTAREWQILFDVIESPTAHGAAARRGRSPHTVQNQLKSVFRKLDVHSVAELLSLVLRHGIPKSDSSRPVLRIAN